MDHDSFGSFLNSSLETDYKESSLILSTLEDIEYLYRGKSSKLPQDSSEKTNIFSCCEIQNQSIYIENSFELNEVRDQS